MGGDIGMPAAAAISGGVAYAISADQLALAWAYQEMAAEMRSHWKNTFMPCEVNAVNEVCAVPKYEPQYLVTAGRYVASVRQQFAGAMDEIQRGAGRYCTGMTAGLIRDIQLAESAAAGSAMNFAYRYEEARKIALDGIRFSERQQVLGLGRDLISGSAQYSQLANSALSGLGDAAARTVSGIERALGRKEVRNDGSSANASAANNGVSPMYASTTNTGGRGSFSGFHVPIGSTPGMEAQAIVGQTIKVGGVNSGSMAQGSAAMNYGFSNMPGMGFNASAASDSSGNTPTAAGGASMDNESFIR